MLGSLFGFSDCCVVFWFQCLVLVVLILRIGGCLMYVCDDVLLFVLLA